MMDQAAVTVFVCVTCRGKDDDTARPGQLMFDALTDGLRAHAEAAVTDTPVECLSVCKRPCTIAVAAAGKWTYVVGDLNHLDHAEDVIASAIRYAATENGIIPWRERPRSFRSGVVSRIPPLGFVPVSPPER